LLRNHNDYPLNYTSVIGIIAGIFTAASLLPQLIKIIREKQVEDLSAGMFITLMVGLALWIAYGFLRSDLPIIATNCFSFLLNISILILRFKYKKGD
jgi:MtN3 and saliva related transmembrane protein